MGGPESGEEAPPLICRGEMGCSSLGVLGLMRFIHHSDGLKWAFGTGLQENMHIDGVWCATAQIQSKEVLHTNRSNIHFDPHVARGRCP